MTYVLGCVDENCECDPCCCDEDPNCDPSEERDIEIFNDLKCCYGPWDTYIKKDGDWTLDHTIYCLTDVYTYYSTVPDVGPEDYIVVLTGKSVDWDPLEDSLVHDCWFDLDPHSPSN